MEMKLWFVKDNDAVRGGAEYEIKDDVYDFPFARTHCIDRQTSPIVLEVELLVARVNVQEPLGADKLRERFLELHERVWKVQIHRAHTGRLKFFGAFRDLLLVALHLSKEG